MVGTARLLIYQTSSPSSWRHNSSFCLPQPPPKPRALEAEAQAQACVFGMWAFFGTITLLGTAIPSALQWPLPAFLWLGRRPLANCPGFPAVSLCSAPEKGLWPARPNALGAARVALAPGVTPDPSTAWTTGKPSFWVQELEKGNRGKKKKKPISNWSSSWKMGLRGSSMHPPPPPKSWVWDVW